MQPENDRDDVMPPCNLIRIGLNLSPDGIANRLERTGDSQPLTMMVKNRQTQLSGPTTS